MNLAIVWEISGLQHISIKNQVNPHLNFNCLNLLRNLCSPHTERVIISDPIFFKGGIERNPQLSRIFMMAQWGKIESEKSAKSMLVFEIFLIKQSQQSGLDPVGQKKV